MAANISGPGIRGPALLLYRERQRQALLLAAQGISYEEIANRLGWKSKQAAHAAVKAAVELRMKEPLDEFRTKRLAEIEDLKDKWRPKSGPMSVMDENGNERLEDKGLRAMVLLIERECALSGIPLTGRATEVNVFASAQAGGGEPPLPMPLPTDPADRARLFAIVMEARQIYERAGLAPPVEPGSDRALGPGSGEGTPVLVR